MLFHLSGAREDRRRSVSERLDVAARLAGELVLDVLIDLDVLGDSIGRRLDFGEGASGEILRDRSITRESCRSRAVCGGKRFGYGLSHTGAPSAAIGVSSNSLLPRVHLPLRR